MRKLSKVIMTICMVLSLCIVNITSVKADECSEGGSHNWKILGTSYNCVYGGVPAYQCTKCGYSYCDGHWEDGGKEHVFVEKYIKASFSQAGKHTIVCSECNYEELNKVYNKVSSTVEVSKKKFVYDGNAHKLNVTLVEDVKGVKLYAGTDYTVTNNPTHTAIGVYNATIQLKGNYTGSKKVYYAIVPKAVTSKIKLSAYNAVKVSWSKVSGATGYRVYYRKYGASSWKYKDTTGTSKNITGLAGGTKYQFKVCPYITGSGGTKYINTVSASVKSTTTLKKICKPAAFKYKKGQVKIAWYNIKAETGYQISRSTSSTGTHIVSTIKTTTGNGKILKTTEGKKYYYKVRAYKTVGDKKVYGPWSKVKTYTCGKTPASGLDTGDPIVKIALSKVGKQGICEQIATEIVHEFVETCWNGNWDMYNQRKSRDTNVTTPMIGDYVNYYSVPPSNAAHVAIYLGNGKCLHGNWGGSGDVWSGKGTAQIGALNIPGASKPFYDRVK